MYDADKPMLVGLVLLISALVGLLASGVLGGSTFSNALNDVYFKTINIDGIPVKVEVADDENERRLGLSNRPRIPENRGMLFVFDTADHYGIWMKDMQFPLDIFWLNEDGVIVAMWEYAHPDSYPQVFEPDQPANYIVEVTGGFAEIYNIEIGDTITGI
jgi:hypothetical protein